jgi:hypothetical protein
LKRQKREIEELLQKLQVSMLTKSTLVTVPTSLVDRQKAAWFSGGFPLFKKIRFN